MKWILNLPRTPMLMYYFAKFIGLAPFTVIQNRFHPPSLLSKLYTVTVAAIYFCVAIIALRDIMANILTHSLFQIAEIGTRTLHLTSFPPTLLILMIFAIRYKKILYIMNRLYDIGDQFKSLGIEEVHGEFFRNIFVKTLTTNAVIITTCVMLCAIEPHWPILYSIKYVIDAWLYLNMVLIFTQVLFCIRQRFKLINEKLYNVFRPADLHSRSRNRLQIVAMCGNSRNDDQRRTIDFTDLQHVRKIEALHFELCDLVHQTTHLFEIPILSKTLAFCTELMTHCFWIYTLIVRRNLGQLCSTTEIVSFMIGIMCPLLKIVMVNVGLIGIAYASVKTCNEGNAMKAVLCKVWYKFRPRDLQNEFFMFSLQLMQRPVAVSIFGFFDLDYSHVYQILCFVIAYQIIMIQFDTSQLSPGTCEMHHEMGHAAQK